MTALEVVDVVGGIAVKVCTASIAFAALVAILLVLARPARDAALYIAPEAVDAVRALAADIRARHEAGLARLAALDEAESPGAVRLAQHEDAVQMLRGAS